MVNVETLADQTQVLIQFCLFWCTDDTADWPIQTVNWHLLQMLKSKRIGW